MASPRISEPFELLTKLLDLLSEDELRILVKNFFRRRFNIYADITHGPGEHGADVIAAVGPVDDPIEKHQVFLIQVKRGDISLGDWRKGLCGQMAELYYRSHNILDLNPSAPRRILLVSSGQLKQEATNAIAAWNGKLPIPVETIDKFQLAKLLYDRGYDAERVRLELLEQAAPPTPSLVKIDSTASQGGTGP